MPGAAVATLAVLCFAITSWSLATADWEALAASNWEALAANKKADAQQAQRESLEEAASEAPVRAVRECSQ